jgi:outer membrane protein assembly factor BamA
MVQCNPRLEEISFKRNTGFTTAELKKSIVSKADGPFRERRLFKDSEQIRDMYERAGYSQVSVKYSTELDEAGGKAKAAFTIAEPQP